MSDWYPAIKTRPSPDCPDFIDLDLWESDQVHEGWAIEASVGPERMFWLNGCFASWWPKLTMERASFAAFLQPRRDDD